MTEQVEKVALKPCPFCGGEAERFTIGADEPSNAGGDVIFCTRCQASSHVEFGRKENLVSAWNTRTPQDDSVARIVAWLRGPAFGNRHPEDTAYARHIADAIERGDWR